MSSNSNNSALGISLGSVTTAGVTIRLADPYVIPSTIPTAFTSLSTASASYASNAASRAVLRTGDTMTGDLNMRCNINVWCNLAIGSNLNVSNALRVPQVKGNVTFLGGAVTVQSPLAVQGSFDVAGPVTLSNGPVSILGSSFAVVNSGGGGGGGGGGDSLSVSGGRVALMSNDLVVAGGGSVLISGDGSVSLSNGCDLAVECNVRIKGVSLMSNSVSIYGPASAGATPSAFPALDVQGSVVVHDQLVLASGEADYALPPVVLVGSNTTVPTSGSSGLVEELEGVYVASASEADAGAAYLGFYAPSEAAIDATTSNAWGATLSVYNAIAYQVAIGAAVMQGNDPNNPGFSIAPNTMSAMLADMQVQGAYFVIGTNTDPLYYTGFYPASYFGQDVITYGPNYQFFPTNTTLLITVYVPDPKSESTPLAHPYVGSNTTSLAWLQIDLPTRTRVTDYTIKVARDDVYTAPTSFALLGSTDEGATWTTIDSRSNNVGWVDYSNAGYSLTFPTNNKMMYFDHLRFLVRETANSNVSVNARLSFTGAIVDSNATRLVVTRDGRLGVGTLEPTSTFDLRGSMYVRDGITQSNGMTVSGPSVLSESMTVHGPTTLSNEVAIYDSLYVSNSPVFIDDTLNVKGAAIFSNTGVFYSTVSVSNAPVFANSNLTVQGVSYLSNDVNVYKRLSVSNWPAFFNSNLTVQGISYLSNDVNIYDVLSVSNSPAFLESNLTVLGDTSLSNTVRVYNTLSVSNAPAFFNSNLTAQGVTALSNDVNVYKQLSVSNCPAFFNSNLTVQGISYLSNDVNVYRQLSVSNWPAFFNSNLTVQGVSYWSNDVNVYKRLSVSNWPAFFQSNLTVQGVSFLSNDVNVYRQLSVSNWPAFFNSNLTVQGISFLSNDVNVYKQLSVSNWPAFFNSNLTVQGISFLSNDVNVYKQLSVSNWPAFFASNLTVQGISFLSNDVNVYRQLSVSNWPAFFNSNMTVQGVTALSNAVNTYGPTSVSNGSLFVNCNLTVLASGAFGDSTVVPPGPFTGTNTATLSSFAPLAGTYVSSGSVGFVAPYNAFDYNNGTTSENVAGGYSGGLPNVSSAQTTVSGSTTTGQWLQIQLPFAMPLITLNLRISTVNINKAPTSAVVAGSMDGSTWTLVSTIASISLVADTFSQIAINSASISYLYYRVIFTSTGGSGNVAISDIYFTMLSRLNVSFGQLAVSNMSTSLNGNLTVTGVSALSNDVNVYRQLSVSNWPAYFNSNLTVQGVSALSNDVNVYKQLSVSNWPAFFDSNLTVQGVSALSNDVNVYKQLSVSNWPAFFSSNLTIQGVSVLSNDVNVYRQLSVSNWPAFFSSNLTVQGVSALSNDVNVYKQLSVSNWPAFFNSNLTVQGVSALSNDVNVYKQLSVSNWPAFFNSNLTVQGVSALSNDVNVYRQLSVSNWPAFFNSNLTVQGVSALSNDVNVYRQLSVSNWPAFLQSNLTVVGVTALSNQVNTYGQLSVSNAPAFFGSNVNVLGAANVYGVLTVSNAATFTSNLVSMCNVTTSNVFASNLTASRLVTTQDINFTGQLLQNGVPYIGSQWSNTGANVYVLQSNVGIRTLPSYPLHVNGQGFFAFNGTRGISLCNSVSGASGNPAEVYFDKTVNGANFASAIGMDGSGRNFYVWVNGSDRISVDTNGRVGIGTTSPQYALDVPNTIGANTILTSNIQFTNTNGTGLRWDYSSDYAEVKFYADSGNAGYLMIKTGDDGSEPIIFQQTNSERMRIAGNGYIGIGRSDPSYLLDVNGATRISGDVTIGTSALRMQNSAIYDNGNLILETDDVVTIKGGSGSASFNNGSLTCRNIDTQGYSMNVYNTITNNNAESTWAIDCRPNMDSRINKDCLGMRLNSSGFGDGSGTTMRIFLGGSQNTGTNWSQNTGIIDMGLNNNASDARFSLRIAGNEKLHIDQSSVSVYNATFNNNSDHRVKKNITKLSVDVLDIIKALEPCKFDFMTGADKSVPSAGFLAHELQQVLPDLVTGTLDQVDGEGAPILQTVQYNAIIAYLTAGMKELIDKVNRLEEFIAAK